METLLAKAHLLHSYLDKPIPEPQSNGVIAAGSSSELIVDEIIVDEIMVENSGKTIVESGSEIIGESSSVIVEEQSGNIVVEENSCGGAAKSSSKIEVENRSVIIVWKSSKWEDVEMINLKYVIVEEPRGSVGTEKDYCVREKRIG